METILSPTRGGERSYPNQDKAVALAKERGARLIFLYVSDVEFLNQVASPVLIDVAEELDEMGEFMLTMAKERASKNDVDAESIVHRGVFREVLEKVIPEFEVDTLVLGSSDDETGLTTPEYLLKLSRSLAEDFGVEVIVLREGEILETVKA